MISNAKVTEARRAAFDALHRVEMEEAYASSILASDRHDNLSREDHALLQELVLGVLRWRGQLDFLIEHYTRRKLTKLDPEVLIALRMGLYQLRFLSRIPPHAAINEAVKLVKELRKQSAAPLVNAVLRAAQRDANVDLTRLTRSIEDPIEQLSVESSHPTWLIERWIVRFGDEETRALALANNAAPRQAFRFNTKRVTETEIRAWFESQGMIIRESSLTPGAAFAEKGSLTINSEPVREGWISFQDEASQFVAYLTAPRPSEIEPLKFLDLCAAPGNKTMLISSMLPEKSLVVAGDVHFHRLRAMRELSIHQGYESLNLIQLDASGDLPFTQPGNFDLVLLDAPCSGLGTLARHPEIKWRTKLEKVLELSLLQSRLIENAAGQVRAGGLLIYAVCSTEIEEGEEVIRRFRHSHSEYRDVTREKLIESGIDPAPLLTSTFGARTFPHRQGTEGFFICVLWKRK
ncbi:MAG: 16S rRNA (cytosine(967)-C(5))-methyltransferase RsmB [Acidobacteria bacterium]|nr:16S rRNA (cytosine(967)-C(5))-methyltransferase RsmB [Acidobacteriota bacterium]